MHHVILQAVAAGGERPLIDYDGTALLQLAVFIVLALAASRLLFRPYLRMRDQRTEGIDGARAEADRMSAEADAKLADYEQKLTSARRRADDERRKIRGEAAAHEREVTEKARSEAHRAIEAARETVRAETSEARAELMPRADEIAGEIASKLLGRKVA